MADIFSAKRSIHYCAATIFSILLPKITTAHKAIIAAKSEHGNRTKPDIKVFLAGDSVAAGVGASSFDTSIGGRLANSLAKNNWVTFTNVAVSGSRMADLTTVPEEKQDIIVLFIASNDLFHFTNLREFENSTTEALERYSKKAKKVILIGPADIGGATAIPLILKPVYAIQWPKYAAIMMTVAAKHSNVTYIYPADYKEKLQSYGHIEAIDGFHPNDNGHKFWAQLILSKIKH